MANKELFKQAIAEAKSVREAAIANAKEALEEAEKRRSDKNTKYNNRPVELKGRGGLEPTRFGDWEVKGIASDF